MNKVLALILVLVLSLTGCVNRSDAYSDKEIEKEKAFAEQYLKEKYPEHTFEVTVSNEYTEGSDGIIPVTPGYHLSVYGIDENGKRIDLYKSYEGNKRTYRENYQK